METGALPMSGAVSKGYNFTSTWEQNTPLTEQQQAAVAALARAVSERPFPQNLEQKSSGKDGAVSLLWFRRKMRGRRSLGLWMPFCLSPLGSTQITGKIDLYVHLVMIDAAQIIILYEKKNSSGHDTKDGYGG
ncbi:hypothetical protein J5N97_017472 [Dioscorea zingiberensis]|uniref:Uncharacterized protein n=1 Tax=Dioscorea zingiberensis TaxID=325984 RepID=A0A9D5CN90_9LILI|nr:hypothetical protein J5N97_017472 [Dioscorea zingiberensis]